MGIFDPNADAGGGGIQPGRKHLTCVNAEVKPCKSGRDSINFEFRTDNDKKMFKTVVVNSIFSSVIKGMMLGLGIDPARYGEATLQQIAFAFSGTDGDAWCEIPPEKQYLEPKFFYDKTSTREPPKIGKAAPAPQSMARPTQQTLAPESAGYQDDPIPF